MKLTPTLRSALITITSFIFVITAVHAWTGPSTTPPNDNVATPLTISAVSQSKAGGLDVGWLNAVGSIKVGNTSAVCDTVLAGAIRWTGSAFEGCNGTAWLPFSGGTSGSSVSNSPYWAFKGKSTSVISSSVYFNTGCSFSVDNAFTPTINVTVSGAAGAGCSDSANSTSVGCNWAWYQGSPEYFYYLNSTGVATFNLQTGVLTCSATGDVPSSPTTATITPDPSLCNTGS